MRQIGGLHRRVIDIGVLQDDGVRLARIEVPAQGDRSGDLQSRSGARAAQLAAPGRGRPGHRGHPQVSAQGVQPGRLSAGERCHGHHADHAAGEHPAVQPASRRRSYGGAGVGTRSCRRLPGEMLRKKWYG